MEKITTTLKKGCKGEDVKTLQRLLNLYPDGIFGTLTEEGVKKFQKEHSLAEDGIVGMKTCQCLYADEWLEKSSRHISKIILHCTATREGQAVTVDQVRRMHTQPISAGGRGWSDIGYHYLIDLEGKVHKGRNVNISGAHCSGHNSDSIGVVYVGGLDRDGKAKDTRTAAQKESMKNLVEKLLKMYNLTKHAVHGHNEYANKACPCFNVRAEMESFNA